MSAPWRRLPLEEVPYHPPSQQELGTSFASSLSDTVVCMIFGILFRTLPFWRNRKRLPRSLFQKHCEELGGCSNDGNTKTKTNRKHDTKARAGVTGNPLYGGTRWILTPPCSLAGVYMSHLRRLKRTNKLLTKKGKWECTFTGIISEVLKKTGVVWIALWLFGYHPKEGVPEKTCLT